MPLEGVALSVEPVELLLVLFISESVLAVIIKGDAVVLDCVHCLLMACDGSVVPVELLVPKLVVLSHELCLLDLNYDVVGVVVGLISHALLKPRMLLLVGYETDVEGLDLPLKNMNLLL